MDARKLTLRAHQALLNGSGKFGYFEQRGITREVVQQAYVGFEAGAFTYPCIGKSGGLLGIHFKSEDRDDKGKRRQWWEGYASDLPSKGRGRRPDDPAKVIPFGLETLKNVEPGSQVVLCCGEEDALSLRMLGYTALSQPGAGLLEPVYAKEFAGLEILVFYDAGEEKKAHEDGRKLLEAGAKNVRFIEWSEEAPHGADINDRLVEDPEGFEDWVADMVGSAKPVRSADPEDTKHEGEPDRYAGESRGAKEGKPTQAELLLRFAEEAELFHIPAGDAYATVRVHGHRETHPVRSKGFRQWLVRGFYEEQGKPPGVQALQDALGVLEARAQFDGPEYPVHVRVAERDGAVYVDLANDRWEVVKITQEGWEVIPDPPVRFRRTRGMLPLPKPAKQGAVKWLRRFINLGDKDEASWRLLLAWLIQALRPTGPYPVLILLGEQGSAKSTVERILRALIDPSTVPLRATPRSERDLMIAANNSWVVAFDNISFLQPWLSDALCRLSTGGGFGTRTLYENDEETLFCAMRPVILNGITDVATRPDLLDRAIAMTLSPIPEEKRKPEAELWDKFEGERPMILGGLFDAVSHALKAVEDVRLKGMPRMADFAVWATAAEGAFGWEEGAFMEAYAGNQEEANETLLEGDPVAGAVQEFMRSQDEWTGTAGELWKKLGDLVDDEVRKSKAWPGASNALTGRLRRLAPALRRAGIEYEEGREGHKGTRTKTLKKSPAKDRQQRQQRQHEGKHPQSEGFGTDDLADSLWAADNGKGHTDGLKDEHRQQEIPVNARFADGAVDADEDLRPHSRLASLLEDRPNWLREQARKCLQEGSPERLSRPLASTIALEYLGDVRRWREALSFVEENLEGLT